MLASLFAICQYNFMHCISYHVTSLMGITRPRQILFGKFLSQKSEICFDANSKYSKLNNPKKPYHSGLHLIHPSSLDESRKPSRGVCTDGYWSMRSVRPDSEKGELKLLG